MKVSVVVLRLPSVASRPVIVTVTSLVGWLLSLTVKLCCVPASLVVRVALLIVRPAQSLSATVAVPVAVVMLSLALVASAMLLSVTVKDFAGFDQAVVRDVDGHGLGGLAGAEAEAASDRGVVVAGRGGAVGAGVVDRGGAARAPERVTVKVAVPSASFTLTLPMASVGAASLSVLVTTTVPLWALAPA